MERLSIIAALAITLFLSLMLSTLGREPSRLVASPAKPVVQQEFRL